jgi:hypothetical protein
MRTSPALSGAAFLTLAAALWLGGAPAGGQQPAKDTKSADELIKALKAADADVRRQAVEALAQLGADKGKGAAPSLEQLLTHAAQDNPDIRVAEAKVREAEAELSRTRLIVAQKVVKLYQDIAAQRAAVAETEQRFKTVERLYQAKGVSQAELDAAKQVVIQAKAKLEGLEAELPFLLGRSEPLKGAAAHPAGDPKTTVRWTARVWYDADMRAAQRVPVQVYLRFSPDGKSLISRDDAGTLKLWDIATGKEVTRFGDDAEFVRRVYLDLTGVVPTAEAVQKYLKSNDPDKAAKLIDELLASADFSQHVQRAWVEKLLTPPPDSMAQRIRRALDTPVVASYDNQSLREILENIEKVYGIPFVATNIKFPAVSLSFKGKTPLGAVLQALQDSSDDLRFVVRDYGVLVTTKSRVPEDGVLLGEFWRRAPEQAKPAPKRP